MYPTQAVRIGMDVTVAFPIGITVAGPKIGLSYHFSSLLLTPFTIRK
jgi:hypothetical protein